MQNAMERRLLLLIACRGTLGKRAPSDDYDTLAYGHEYIW